MQKPTIQSIHKNYYQADDKKHIILSQQYDNKNKEWKFIGYRCKHCDNGFKSLTTILKHPTVCKELNSIKKREITMPIQTIMIKGERYYRWGDSGKPYKNRADAEKQAAAAYASGYKKPEDKMKKK